MSGRGRLLRCYPPAWRERYGADLAAFLDDTYPGGLPPRAAGSLLAGALREWVGLARRRPVAESAGARVRGGVVMVLVGWAAFVVAGSSFAKVSEHFDEPLSRPARAVPDAAYAIVQAAATMCGGAVVVGVVLAVPAMRRFLAGGGWRVIRRHVLRAAVVTALAAATTLILTAWAHRLTAPQRNGGSTGYAAVFLVWAGLLVVTLSLWTVVGVLTTLRLNLSRRVLLAEAALATGVTAGMLVMSVAAAVWWKSVASSVPWFFGWSPQLMATLALMIAGLAAGTVGVLSIARAAPYVVAGRAPT